MEYNKIIAVTGLPGLYEMLNSKTDGAIVRSLDDKTSKFVSSRIHNFSHLESIEIYTVRENVNLIDILKAMDSSKEKLPDEKDNAAVKGYFTKVYPDLDFERVYNSDLKKMVKWFTVLKNNNVELKLSEAPEDVQENTEAESAGATVAEKSVKTPAKAPAKKAAPKAEPEEDKEAEKPKAKKTAKKKTSEDDKEAAAVAEKPKKAAPKKKS
ncbi:DUF5606 family protein [Flavitalea flava]